MTSKKTTKTHQPKTVKTPAPAPEVKVAAAAATAAAPEAWSAAEARRTTRPPTTEKTAIRFPVVLLHQLKMAVLHAQRHDPSLTMTGVITRGVELVLRELEKTYGEPPPSDGDVKLRTGRRLSM